MVGGNGGFGADGGWGIMFLAFLALMGGGWNGNRGGQPLPNNIATTDTVNAAVQFSSLQDQNRDILTNEANMQQNLMQYVGDHYNELQRDISANAVSIANLQAHQAQCCCDIKQEIAGQTLDFTRQLASLNLDNERRFNAINAKMDAQEIQRLRDRVSNLEADVRMQGVVRYPNGFVYNAGGNPFCGNQLIA